MNMNGLFYVKAVKIYVYNLVFIYSIFGYVKWTRKDVQEF